MSTNVFRRDQATGQIVPVEMNHGPFVHDAHDREPWVDLDNPPMPYDATWEPTVKPEPAPALDTKHGYWPVTTGVQHPLAAAIMAELTDMDAEERRELRTANLREPEAHKRAGDQLVKQRDRRKTRNRG